MCLGRKCVQWAQKLVPLQHSLNPSKPETCRVPLEAYECFCALSGDPEGPRSTGGPVRQELSEGRGAPGLCCDVLRLLGSENLGLADGLGLRGSVGSWFQGTLGLGPKILKRRQPRRAARNSKFNPKPKPLPPRVQTTQTKHGNNFGLRELGGHGPQGQLGRSHGLAPHFSRAGWDS